MRAIVFVLRGCPVGWLGAYGNEWVGTPHLDRFAAESVVFDRHISDCPEPSAASRAWVGDASPTGSRLSDALRSSGIQSVLVRANHPDTDAPEWFYAGWDEVFDTRPQQEDKSPLDALLRSLPSLLDRLANEPDSCSGSRSTASSRRGTCNRMCLRPISATRMKRTKAKRRPKAIAEEDEHGGRR